MPAPCATIPTGSGCRSCRRFSPGISRCDGVMTGRVYCSYFDHHYLSRGLALYHSLQRHAPGARLWVLCLSDRCFDILQKAALPNLKPVRLSEFEAADPETAATSASRKPVEYYFTCTPGWMLYVAQREPDA